MLGAHKAADMYGEPVAGSPPVTADVRRLIVDPALTHLTVHPQIALEFLAVFSRFEFALKVTNYRQPGEGEARVDWIEFANDLADSFDPNRTAQLAAAFAYLTGEPLRRFAVQNGALGWFQLNLPPGASDAETVVRLIRQVRNNLFHGGKYAPDPEGGPDRDRRLVESALVLLPELRRLVPAVDAAYVD